MAHHQRTIASEKTLTARHSSPQQLTTMDGNNTNFVGGHRLIFRKITNLFFFINLSIIFSGLFFAQCGLDHRVRGGRRHRLTSTTITSSEHLHQWSQPSNPTATCAQRVTLSLALQTQSKNSADHVSELGSPGRLWRWASFVARQYSHRRATQNLHDCKIVAQLSASHGSRIPLAFVVRTGNQGLTQRLGASPNRPVWSGAAVQVPKEGRSRETTTRCIKGLENVNRSIYGSSQPRHSLVLVRIPATSAPTVQTPKRCHVWLFGRLEPLVETLSAPTLPSNPPTRVTGG